MMETNIDSTIALFQCQILCDRITIFRRQVVKQNNFESVLGAFEKNK